VDDGKFEHEVSRLISSHRDVFTLDDFHTFERLDCESHMRLNGVRRKDGDLHWGS
jgi:hypothetical protein